jgi:hypothetical protein
MDRSARREDLVETDRAQKRLDDPRSNPIPEEANSNQQTPPQGPVQPDVIPEGADETFVHGAGI